MVWQEGESLSDDEDDDGGGGGGGSRLSDDMTATLGLDTDIVVMNEAIIITTQALHRKNQDLLSFLNDLDNAVSQSLCRSR